MAKSPVSPRLLAATFTLLGGLASTACDAPEDKWFDGYAAVNYCFRVTSFGQDLSTEEFKEHWGALFDGASLSFDSFVQEGQVPYRVWSGRFPESADSSATVPFAVLHCETRQEPLSAGLELERATVRGFHGYLGKGGRFPQDSGPYQVELRDEAPDEAGGRIISITATYSAWDWFSGVQQYPHEFELIVNGKSLGKRPL